jgi:general secretion pathway protein D
MRTFKYLALLFCSVALLVTPAEAKNRKGEKLLKEGREAETRRLWTEALEKYEEAMLADPDEPAYQIAARRVRFQAAMEHIDRGQKLRQEGKLEQALEEFKQGYAIDPALPIAEQEYKRTLEMIDRDKKGAAATPEQRGMTPAEKAEQATTELAERLLPLPELKPITREVHALTMQNQPVRVLYETLGKLTGINVIFDPEFQPSGPGGRDRYTIDLTNTTLDQALDYLAIQTKTYWKPLSDNAIFVTNDNPQKRRDYEDYVVKTFFVKNATTVQELQELATTIRTVTEIRRSFVYNAQNAILFRGTADQVALAEKLLQDLDKPRAEVVVDVIFMEANRARVRDLALTFTTSGLPGINLPITYRPTIFGQSPTNGDDDGNGNGDGDGDGDGGGTSSSLIPLSRLGDLSARDFVIPAPGALIQALLTDSQSRVLSQPQVRAISNQKAELKIGDRIPYAQGSFQPGVGTVGLNPLVSTQFNFLDTGTNVTIVPVVHGRDEVSLHVEIDISAKSGEVNLGGLAQPQVSRRTIIHDIRMKQGEASILGGLVSTQETRSSAGVPWIMDVPVLGRLFGSEKLDRARGELLIVLVPHVIRAPEFTEANLRGVAAGSDQVLKLNYQPRTGETATEAAPATPAPGAAPAAKPPAGNPPAATPPAATVPAEAPPTPQPPVPAGTPLPTPGTDPAPAAAPPTPPAPTPAPGAARLLFNTPSVQAPLNAPVLVSLQAENVSNLFTAPVRVKYDPAVLRLNRIEPGSLMTADGQQVNFSHQVVPQTGEIIITLNRLPGTGTVSGSGPLVNLVFDAIGKGTSQVTVSEAGLKNMELQPIEAGQPSVSVVVQ